uniref:ORF4 n=1 Tax=Secalivirus TaxID=1224520 RepID=J7LLM5_9CALI|nr:ORF4 [Secalivirus]
MLFEAADESFEFTKDAFDMTKDMKSPMSINEKALGTEDMPPSYEEAVRDVNTDDAPLTDQTSHLFHMPNFHPIVHLGGGHGAISTSMRDSTMLQMQTNQQAWKTQENQQMYNIHSELSNQAFNQKSSLSAQSFNQNSQLMQQANVEKMGDWADQTAIMAQVFSRNGMPAYLAFDPSQMSHYSPDTVVTPGGMPTNLNPGTVPMQLPVPPQPPVSKLYILFIFNFFRCKYFIRNS